MKFILTTRLIFFFILLLTLPGCFIKGCGYDEDFEKGRKAGEKAQYERGVRASYQWKTREKAQKKYYKIGYKTGVQEAILSGDASPKQEYLYVYCFVFAILGFLAQYIFFFLLRRFDILNDLELLLITFHLDPLSDPVIKKRLLISNMRTYIEGKREQN